MSAVTTRPPAGAAARNGGTTNAEAWRDILLGLRKLDLDYRADETNPDGPWRARCPVCRTTTLDGEFPLTITSSGNLSCKHRCDPSEIAACIDAGLANTDAPHVDATIVTLEAFAAVDEPGAAPIVGEPGCILIPEGGDVMLYGDGGAGKTTLSIDLAFHLASGTDWLGMEIPCPVRVLLIENEGPRPLFRQKLRRKLTAWPGPSVDGRITVFEEPWAEFSFAADEWRGKLARLVAEHEVDVLIAGPLTRLGMDAAGTLQEVRMFAELAADVRKQSGRRLTQVLVHHENKGGAVSGAWEGAGDTLLHVEAAGNGFTVVHVQKARWDSERHGKTLRLAWTEGESFKLEGDRDYLAELVALLSDGQWRTVKDMSARDADGGIGAGEKAIKATLNEYPERFESRTGDAAKMVGRSPSATVWLVRSGSNAPDAPCASLGGAEDAAALRPSLKGAAADERTPGESPTGASAASAHPSQPVLDDELERLAARAAEMETENA